VDEPWGADHTVGPTRCGPYGEGTCRHRGSTWLGSSPLGSSHGAAMQAAHMAKLPSWGLGEEIELFSRRPTDSITVRS
jgi:hypothetical protein